MLNYSSNSQTLTPVAIGGVGGSGTRLIARMLYELDYFIGSDLNNAYDNLWFTLLFKHPDILRPEDNYKNFHKSLNIFLKTMIGEQTLTNLEKDRIKQLASSDRPQHTREWLYERMKSLLLAVQYKKNYGLWGWKEPNTHVILQLLHHALPEMRYIHVMRSGLDMAFSHNQNQLNLWGSTYFDIDDFEINPYFSLKYWCKVHKKVISIGETINHRFFLLNYDCLCSNPEKEIEKLLIFLQAQATSLQRKKLIEMVNSPVSVGRYKKHELHIFDPDDLEYVSKLGFDL